MSFFIEAAVVGGAYLVGSFPTGYGLARLGGISDIRKHGSGNTGATNVARTLGVRYFAPVVFIDAGKASCYLLLVRAYGWDEPFLVLVGLALLMGNGYSLFLNFTGGKGFATTVGIVSVLKPDLFVVLMPFWLLVFAITRTIGVASAAVCTSFALYTYYVLPSHFLASAYGVMGAWGVWRHRDNLRRYWYACIAGKKFN